MITRIVRMTFDPARTEEFLDLFNNSKNDIRSFEGCLHLELLRDVNEPHVFVTYSQWRSEADLQLYRQSQLFINTWAQTRRLFSAKADAWTLESMFKA